MPFSKFGHNRNRTNWLVLVFTLLISELTYLTAATGDPDGFNANVNATVSQTSAVQPDGKVLIGGNFTAVGLTSRRVLARFNADGTFDAAFNPAPNSIIFCTAVQEDEKILLGGLFSTVGDGETL